MIPQEFLDLFTTKIAHAHLATIFPDGTPQVTPVWFDYDGTHIIINTAKGRVKYNNMLRDPRVTIAISDPQNPGRYIQLRGCVASMSEADGDAVIDRLAKKYMGVDKYPWHSASEVRVTVRIEIQRTQGMG
ncbi:MAG: PPOX class F420-dependent oxidoreductase [Chloroflexi bacterium]|nr:PPOX class F420-dependent oxidoreductase [Chloroflexota bacterium]